MINVNVKHGEETNKEYDCEKPRSRVVPLLVQPSIVPLSWPPKYRLRCVPNVRMRRAKQARDTVCPREVEIHPRTTLIPETGIVNRDSGPVLLSQGTTYDMHDFAMLYHYDTLPRLCVFLYLDQLLSLT